MRDSRPLRGPRFLPGLFVLAFLATVASPFPALADPHPETSPAHRAKASPTRPNILILLADDLGWGDVSYHGSEILTPNIDGLARKGLELDRFYVQPTCSPTRTALMTGKSPMRLGITRPLSKNETGGLPP